MDYIGFGGATVLSADLMNFITPSQYNPIYKFIVNFFAGKSVIFMKYSKFFFDPHRVAYPGIIALGSYIYIYLKRKKLGILIWKKINIYLSLSVFFMLITLGPFLKILNRWMLPLKEGIYLVIPLPIIQKTPFLLLCKSGIE